MGGLKREHGAWWHRRMGGGAVERWGIGRQLPQSLESLPSATGSRKLVANGSSNTINNNTNNKNTTQHITTTNITISTTTTTTTGTHIQQLTEKLGDAEREKFKKSKGKVQ